MLIMHNIFILLMVACVLFLPWQVTGDQRLTDLCSVDLCGKEDTMSCPAASVLLLEDVSTSATDESCSLNILYQLRERCNHQQSCSAKTLSRKCCTENTKNRSVTVKYFCIKTSAIVTDCNQRLTGALSSGIRHIYPVLNITVFKEKTEFCQWSIELPRTTPVLFRFRQLMKGNITECGQSSSVQIQYDVTVGKRSKPVRDIPKCLMGRKTASFQILSHKILVWFIPSRFQEKLWLSFSVSGNQSGITTNTTGCLTTDIPTIPPSHLLFNTTPWSQNNAEIVDQATWSSDRFALIGALAAITTIAIFFLVVSSILFIRLHRLRFLSKGFSRLKKIQGGFDMVNKREGTATEQTNVEDYNGTVGKYRNLDEPVYAVAKRRVAANNDDSFLRQLEYSTPTYTAPRPRISSNNFGISNDNPRQKASHVHVSLTDDMFKGVNEARLANNFDDEIIDITTAGDAAPKGRYGGHSQASIVQNVLYDSPDDEAEEGL